MKKTYNVLVLTDHRGHSDQNSLYALVNTMIGHDQCHSIHVSSRGVSTNRGFFVHMDKESLHGTLVNTEFAFTDDSRYMIEGLTKLDVRDFDLVFMRLPRPITDTFLLWLESIFSHAVIINSPKGIIKTSSKEYLLNFPDQCPSMKLVKSKDDVIAYAAQHPIVLKPLREYGGKGLLKINGDQLDDGSDLHDTSLYLDTIKDDLTTDGYLAMKYLKNVSQGDKRILVVGGEIMASSLRLPAEGSWLCNVAQGGTSVASNVTQREKEIIAAITPSLTQQGIVIFGADTLVDDDGDRILSEINTLSIGGFPQAELQTGEPVLIKTINKIFHYADSQY